MTETAYVIPYPRQHMCALCGRRSRRPDMDWCLGCNEIVCEKCDKRVAFKMKNHDVQEHGKREMDVQEDW